MRGFNQAEAHSNTLFWHLGRIRRFWHIPVPARRPNFLDTMRGICEMVAFHTNPDQIQEAVSFAGKKRSQKKCRFFS